MAELHVSASVTLDGYITDEDGGMDWIVMGEERVAALTADVLGADTLVLGRRTYDGFAAFWPDAPTNPDASEAERVIGAQMNAMRKVVFSTTLEAADWPGTTILRDIVPEEIAQLKAASTTGLRIDGSASIVQQLTDLGLIEEYRLLVHPVVLGSGTPLFTGRTDLRLTTTEDLGNGVVLMTYRR